MSGIILFQSKYGATRKYAQWLSEKTGFSCMETRSAKLAEVQTYDAILLGGGVYASGIAGLSFLKKNMNALKNKKILVFFVGASPYDEDNFRAVVSRNMTGTLSGIPCFYCRGAWDLAKMTVMDRNLCKLLRKAIAKKPPEQLEVWEQALFSAEGSCDWTDPRYLDPILKALK